MRDGGPEGYRTAGKPGGMGKETRCADMRVLKGVFEKSAVAFLRVDAKIGFIQSALSRSESEAHTKTRKHEEGIRSQELGISLNTDHWPLITDSAHTENTEG
jgi:hypothetical protein